MNTIRNYINAMFATLPQTPEILRLQAEMLENMEDKFYDLLREGKSEHEAVGIILADIGSADDLRAELGLPEEPRTAPRADHSAFFAERAAFHRRFAIGVPLGILVIICGIIAGAVCDEFTHNDGITAIGFFVPMAIGIAILVYRGIREDWYEKQYRELCPSAESSQTGKDTGKSLSSTVAAILFPITTIVYLAIGFLFGMWHPGWILFLLCAVIVGAVEAVEQFQKQNSDSSQ